MTDCPETEVQILVHISAPSGAKDDARYRKQAEAVLGFESARRHVILRPGHEHIEAEDAAVAAPSATDREKVEVGRHGAQPASGQEHQRHASPSLCALTSPVLRSSPQNRPQTAPSAATPPFTSKRPIRRTQSDSWGTPPSVVPDSQPLVRAETNAGTESPIRRRQPPQSPVEEPAPKRRRLESSVAFSTASPASGPIALLVEIDADPASTTSIQPAPTAPSLSEPPQSPEAHQSSPPLHPSSILPSPTTQNQPAPPPFSSPSPPSSHTHLPPLTHTEPLTIHPPPPPTTSHPFKTHLTPTLTLLAKHADLPKRYQPTLSTRPFRPLERGHWILDCTSFPPHLRTKMWTFLSDFVGQGRAGWGVWCELSVSGSSGLGRGAQVERVEEGRGGDWEGDRVERNGDEGAHQRPSLAGGDGKGEGNGKVMLKIYCWGEIVPHIYIVLFLATSRMVKGAGVQWVDGAGEVVVRMP